jgi:hypothetical protein
MQSIDQLREELMQADANLAKLDQQEAEATRSIARLVLPAHRGDEEAQKKLAEHEAARANIPISRWRLKAVRNSIETEIQQAQAIADREAVKEKARQAKEVVARLRSRGVDMDATVNKLLDEYNAIESDVRELVDLGATRTNVRLVQLACARALLTKLGQIKDLDLRPVPPLERREFAPLTAGWAANAERWISATLNEPTQPAPAEPTTVELTKAGA